MRAGLKTANAGRSKDRPLRTSDGQQLGGSVDEFRRRRGKTATLSEIRFASAPAAKPAD
jgi:hypothetical protein